MIDLAVNTAEMLFLTAAALGARHAFDADHLSVIDGIARQNFSRNPLIARLSGILFSTGHIVVVTLVGVLGAFLYPDLAASPKWLEPIGLAGSGTILILLGVLNLKGAFAQGLSEPRLAGVRSRLFSVRYGWFNSILVGAIFAISLDTVGIALGLSMAGRAIGGSEIALVGILGFGAGMLVIGGLNGLIVTHLIRSSSERSVKLLRMFSGAVGAGNILIGSIALFALAGLDLADALKLDGLVLTGIVLVPVFATAALVAWSSRALHTAK
ncbi:hypothetical protein OKA06_11825 [Novosphingobium sp. MW5]|nr:hypothetical protein [Novosphingobium sp. MW5]